VWRSAEEVHCAAGAAADCSPFCIIFLDEGRDCQRGSESQKYECFLLN
jgi:hypothetical protein